MAAKDHNHTRPAVLGAAVAVPVLACARFSVGATSGDADWRLARAAFRAAGARLRAFQRHCRAMEKSGPSFAIQVRLDRRYDRHLGAFYGALRRLLRTPSPDLAALSAKVDLIIRHDIASLKGGGRCLAALRRDARRFARQA